MKLSENGLMDLRRGELSSLTSGRTGEGIPLWFFPASAPWPSTERRQKGEREPLCSQKQAESRWQVARAPRVQPHAQGEMLHSPVEGQFWLLGMG